MLAWTSLCLRSAGRLEPALAGIVIDSNMASQMKYYPQVVKDMDEKGIIDMEVGIFAYPYPDAKDTSAPTE